MRLVFAFFFSLVSVKSCCKETLSAFQFHVSVEIAFVLVCVRVALWWLTLVGHQLPTKADLSLTC